MSLHSELCSKTYVMKQSIQTQQFYALLLCTKYFDVVSTVSTLFRGYCAQHITNITQNMKDVAMIIAEFTSLSNNNI